MVQHAMAILDQAGTSDARAVPRQLRYVCEAIVPYNLTLLRKRACLIGSDINRDAGMMALQLLDASVRCRIYRGFRVWKSRLDLGCRTRVNRIVMKARQRLRAKVT